MTLNRGGRKLCYGTHLGTTIKVRTIGTAWGPRLRPCGLQPGKFKHANKTIHVEHTTTGLPLLAKRPRPTSFPPLPCFLLHVRQKGGRNAAQLNEKCAHQIPSPHHIAAVLTKKHVRKEEMRGVRQNAPVSARQHPPARSREETHLPLSARTESPSGTPHP